ncbi:hypothetical protein SteCoe_3284 [Stentor coeruleus]|uniref:Uncharacterized protein n=1 Tax=Stentor coeruleus TaxID=5963 RepID=A0A1R2CXH7_9CILI|nr:hypothetical protein SteCoe_3284 [Stentor coeruleus]
MAVSPLKTVKILKTSVNLDNFSQCREINRHYIFANLWEAILEILLFNNSPETALQVFLNTIYFYPKSRKPSFDKRHNLTIKTFTNIFFSPYSSNLKTLLHGPNFFILLEEISGFQTKTKASIILPFQDLLKYNKIQLIEKTVKGDFIWGSKDPNFTVFLLNLDENLYFLHPKQKLDLKNKPSRICFLETTTYVQGEISEDENLEEEDNDEIITIETASTSDFFLKKKVQEEFNLDNYAISSSLHQAAYCGASLCVNCSKMLKRTTHFLINTNCCAYNIYNLKPSSPKISIFTEPKENCIFCNKKASVKEKIYCACCFLNNTIYNNKLKISEECKHTDEYYWIDINYAKNFEQVRCGFCDSIRHKLYLCSACLSCDDQVCLSCLRKNPYINEGTCTSCSMKRVVSLNNF